MKGKKLINFVFNKGEEDQNAKGRNLNLIARRNHCLIDRYYYYLHFTEKRYELIIENLCAEFFLSQRTLRDLVYIHDGYLQELKKRKPGVSFLEMRWPHLKW